MLTDSSAFPVEALLPDGPDIQQRRAELRETWLQLAEQKNVKLDRLYRVLAEARTLADADRAASLIAQDSRDRAERATRVRRDLKAALREAIAIHGSVHTEGDFEATVEDRQAPYLALLAHVEQDDVLNAEEAGDPGRRDQRGRPASSWRKSLRARLDDLNVPSPHDTILLRALHLLPTQR